MTIYVNAVQFVQSWAVPGVLNLETGTRESLPGAGIEAAFIPPNAVPSDTRLATLCSGGTRIPGHHRRRPPVDGKVVPRPAPSGLSSNAAASAIIPARERILTLYRTHLRGREIEIFQNKVLPLAEHVLGDNPNLFEAYLARLIEIAGWLTPQEMRPFWEREVTRDTFRFQRDWDALHQEDRSSSDGYLFTAVRLGAIPDDAESISGVGFEFVRAPLDLLAERLVGQMMIASNRGVKGGGIHPGMIEEDGRFLPTHWGVLVVYPFQSRPGKPAALTTAYSSTPSTPQPRRTYTPFRTNGPVRPVQVIPIPFAALLAEQQAPFAYAARQIDAMARSSAYPRPPLPEFEAMVVFARLWELSVKLLLQNYFRDSL